MVVCSRHSDYVGGLKRENVVQPNLGINVRLYPKKQLAKKELEVWLKW
jgi:hypothetical protein